MSVPSRYMHSPDEMVALEDLERTARLLATLVRRVEDGMDFIGSAARRLGGSAARRLGGCEDRHALSLRGSAAAEATLQPESNLLADLGSRHDPSSSGQTPSGDSGRAARLLRAPVARSQ
ncbi:MAG TPA: hypothetical protein VFS74_09940 [Gemmatimonadales bacterium]|nr:hypothetical protein [Gemmatimonadales bacterium]